MEHNQIDTHDCHPEENTILTDQESGSDGSDSNQDDDQDSESDCESQSTDSDPMDDDRFEFFTGNGMTSRVDGFSEEYKTILLSFAVGMGTASKPTELVAAHKNMMSGLPCRARFETFQLCSHAVGKKCDGEPNIRVAWYGGSRDEIRDILVNGFSTSNGDGFGRVQLFPEKNALDAARASQVDDDGLRHVLQCRVIMGKMEELADGSEQVAPSSNEFDSGVDSVVNPRRYFVWSSCINSQICADYVVSFKGPASLEGYVTRNSASASVSASTTQKRRAVGVVTLEALMAALTRFLNPREMEIVVGLVEDFRAKKFDAEELKRKVRLIAGDRLMLAIKLAASSDVKGSVTVGGFLVEDGFIHLYLAY